MKYLIFIFLIISIQVKTFSQNVVVDSLGFQTFEMQEGDTTYTMKQYFMAFLKEGPNRNQSQEEQALIQKGHLEHLNLLAEQKKINIAGPFADDGEIRGIVIFNVATREEVELLISQDPAVKAGRLLLEVHPWWAAVGSKLE